MTRYKFEHSEVQIVRRGPYAYVEVRHRVPRGDEPDPWEPLFHQQLDPSMGECQRAIEGTKWTEPPPES